MAIEERLARVEASLLELERSLVRIERQVAVLERSLAGVTASAMSVPASAPEGEGGTEVVGAQPIDLVSVMSYTGRTLVALGGAYFLRALTDAAVLRPPIGVVCGLLYAIAWIVMTDRAAATGRPLSATFHATVASLIGFPLLWEAATRFKLVGPDQTAVGMALLTAIALAVAARRQLHSVAWIVVLPAVAASMAMIAATGSILPFAIFAIGLGVATLWLGYMPFYWRFLRWPVAVFADLCIIALALRIASHNQPDAPIAVIAVQLLLLTAYLSSIVLRTLIRGRDVIPFEIVQTAVALLIGFGGAVYVARLTGTGELALAVINLFAGAGCYAVAFAFVARREGASRNFYFYTSLAFVLVVVSTALMLDSDGAALACAMLAMLAAWTAWRVPHMALNLHAAGYTLAAAWESRLTSAAAYAWLAPASGPWLPFTPTTLLVLTAAAVCWLVPTSPRAESWGKYSRLPRLAILTQLAWSIGGVAVALLAPVLSAADTGGIATIRTAVLATSALALAWHSRFDRFREAGYLVYPVLVAGGLKLAAEDFRYSKPATLFVALALYGSALILAPRLTRSASSP